MTNKEDTGWHLDKRVSIATLSMIAVNLILAVGFAVTLDHRIKALESNNATDARLGRIEVILEHEMRARNALELRTAGSIEEIKLLIREVDKNVRELSKR